MVTFDTNDLKKFGKVLTVFGVIFTLVGVMLFFHEGFIAIGSILLLLGVLLIFGQNSEGPEALLAGFFLIIVGPIVGMLVEIYAFTFLFRGFCLTAETFIRKLPLLGSLFDYCHQRMVSFYSRRGGRRVAV